MAILINKEVTAFGGIDLNQLYLRIDYQAELSGKSLNCNVYPYISKTAFTNNWQENVLKIDGLNIRFNFHYDASTNGDPLQYLHDSLKDVLSTDITAIVPDLDENGQAQYDPSTGDLLTKEIITKPKFADEEDITFTDLD